MYCYMETGVLKYPCLSPYLIAKMFIIIIIIFFQEEKEGRVGREVVFKIY